MLCVDARDAAYKLPTVGSAILMTRRSSIILGICGGFAGDRCQDL